MVLIRLVEHIFQLLVRSGNARLSRGYSTPGGEPTPQTEHVDSSKQPDNTPSHSSLRVPGLGAETYLQQVLSFRSRPVCKAAIQLLVFQSSSGYKVKRITHPLLCPVKQAPSVHSFIRPFDLVARSESHPSVPASPHSMFSSEKAVGKFHPRPMFDIPLLFNHTTASTFLPK